MTTIGTFILIKNEAQWIGPHLASILPHIDQMVFFDGNSNDGTLEIIERFQKSHEYGNKISLIKDKNPKNLQDDYVRLFNECLHALDTDLAFFLHPDMIIADPGNIRNLGDGIAYSVGMESFAGDPGKKLYKISSGRSDRWKNIYRLHNPDLGAHYWGHYGAADEDVYFSDITGSSHVHHGHNFDRYPYSVIDSGIKVLHYSDVRTSMRRLDRMTKALMNQGYNIEEAQKLAMEHPRVTLKSGEGFIFESAEYHPIFNAWQDSLNVLK